MALILLILDCFYVSYEFSKSASWVQDRGGVRTAFVANIVLVRYCRRSSPSGVPCGYWRS